jgi:hypothetical protein
MHFICVANAVYQINTRVWLTALSRQLGKTVTLDDIPDAELDRLAEMGFDWIWFLTFGKLARGRSKSHAAMPTGGRSFRKLFATCATMTSPAQVSPSPAIPCMRSSAAMQPWPGPRLSRNCRLITRWAWSTIVVVIPRPRNV